jgi:hypothetical protein
MNNKSNILTAFKGEHEVYDLIKVLFDKPKALNVPMFFFTFLLR